jgi:hypothetical protein
VREKVNFAKFGILFSKNCNPSIQASIISTHFLPEQKKKKKKKIPFVDLKTKISNRISGWKSNLLSQAGYNNIDQNCG